MSMNGMESQDLVALFMRAADDLDFLDCDSGLNPENLGAVIGICVDATRSRRMMAAVTAEAMSVGGRCALALQIIGAAGVRLTAREATGGGSG